MLPNLNPVTLITSVTFITLTLAVAGCNSTDSSPEPDKPFAEATPVNWQSPIKVAEGEAYAGPWRMNESEFRYVDDSTVSLRANGSVAIAWVDNERQNIFLQVYDSDDQARLDQPVNVSRSSEIFSWLPRVVYTSDNRVFAVWQEIVFSGGSHGGEIFFARSLDGGASFDEPINLSQTIAGAGKGRLSEDSWDNGSLDILLGYTGEIFVAWTEYRGALHFRRSTDGGISFEDAMHIVGDDAQPVRAPSLAQGPDGALYLAWSRGESDSADIHLATSSDYGESFSDPIVVHQSDGHSDAPTLAVDTEGAIHLAYAESPNGRFTPGHIAYLQLQRDGRADSEPKMISGSTETHGARAPTMDIDDSGNLVVIWENKPDNNERARGLGHTVSFNAGGRFEDPAIIPGSVPSEDGINGSLQGQLAIKLSVNSHGNIAISNSHIDRGNRSNIIYIRGQVPEQN